MMKSRQQRRFDSFNKTHSSIVMGLINLSECWQKCVDHRGDMLRSNCVKLQKVKKLKIFVLVKYLFLLWRKEKNWRYYFSACLHTCILAGNFSGSVSVLLSHCIECLCDQNERFLMNFFVSVSWILMGTKEMTSTVDVAALVFVWPKFALLKVLCGKVHVIMQHSLSQQFSLFDKCAVINMLKREIRVLR
jgi:hypothetical protein